MLLGKAGEIGKIVGRLAEHLPEKQGREEGADEGERHRGADRRRAASPRACARAIRPVTAPITGPTASSCQMLATSGKLLLPPDHQPHEARDQRPAQRGRGGHEKPGRELGERPVEAFRRAPYRLHLWDDGRAHHRAKQLLLGREVAVDRAFDDARPIGDVVELCCREAMIGEDLQGGRRDFGRSRLFALAPRSAAG